ncbi:Tyr recombinase activity site-specific recombination Tyr recombinase activity CMGI-5 [Cupriavidus metallidurans CH34]|uniref:Tyr recombinase activity site-specific recombination Tyr recombinase activity CMGI-5 n=2 Tax=Cupriavidus metallidurans TaxID=119219 RepID=Q1LJF6_CUPMC|nr:Tyr recombinase activity site-specific recombination Tyr recombinase activity CMGI-5 [Cupriavidus metallidurans CH34]
MGKSRAIESGIYQRGPYSFQVKLMVDGHRVTGTFDTLDEARAYRNSKRAALALDPDARRVLDARVKRHEVKAATLSLALDRYEKEVSAKKKSAESEAHKITRLKRSKLAKMSLYRITADDVTAFLKDLKRDQPGPLQGQPLSDATKRKLVALLSHVFTIARKRWRMAVANPVADIELPSHGKSRKRRLEEGEEQRLLRELAKARQAAIVVPLVRLAIETAMRQGELLALEWKDLRIADTHGTAMLHDTKNGEPRIVPLNATACEILGAMPRPLKGGPVFPIKTAALRAIWEFACERASIEGLRFHDLRHEATSRLFELGLGRIEAASITGHKTLQVLKNYSHLRAEWLAQKMNQAASSQGLAARQL